MILRRVYGRIARIVERFFGRFSRMVPVEVPIFHSTLLKGRTAMVTGGTGGIGYAIALAFVRAGANVIITGRHEDSLRQAVSKIESMCGMERKVFSIVVDNNDPQSFRGKLQEAFRKCPYLDILVNNAGVVGASNSIEDYDRVMNTNLRGPFYLSEAIADEWRLRKMAGNILNVCSASSRRPGTSAYAFSKWGLRSMTLGLAKRYIPYGIVVNGIAPGPTATEKFLGKEGVPTDIRWNKNPTGRLAMPEEVANLAVVLVSDLGRLIVGDIIYMSGGAGVVTYDDI